MWIMTWRLLPSHGKKEKKSSLSVKSLWETVSRLKRSSPLCPAHAQPVTKKTNFQMGCLISGYHVWLERLYSTFLRFVRAVPLWEEIPLYKRPLCGAGTAYFSLLIKADMNNPGLLLNIVARLTKSHRSVQQCFMNFLLITWTFSFHTVGSFLMLDVMSLENGERPYLVSDLNCHLLNHQSV